MSYYDEYDDGVYGFGLGPAGLFAFGFVWVEPSDPIPKNLNYIKVLDNGDYVVDDRYRSMQMNHNRQRVYLALSTDRGSSVADLTFGNRLMKISKKDSSFEDQVKQCIYEALDKLISVGSITIINISISNVDIRNTNIDVIFRDNDTDTIQNVNLNIGAQ